MRNDSGSKLDFTDDWNGSRMLDINGSSQFVGIRAKRPGLPLLLYLHGGPGDAALPLVLKYNGELAEHYTLVIWEQRGAGKSYYKFSDGDHITIDTFVEDIRFLVEQLLLWSGQPKVYLAAHSWGSVIGLSFCRKYPSMVHTYIGCGQVVNMKKSCRIAYDFAVKHAEGKAAERLKKTDCSYTGADWLSDLLFVTRLVVKHRGSLYGARSYNRFVRDFLFSGEYGFRDLLNREKGSLQSIRFLWQELMSVSFEDVTEYEMPVVFVEGQQDYHVSFQLAEEYYQKITSPKKIFRFEKSCHFPHWSQADLFNRIMAELLTAEF